MTPPRRIAGLTLVFSLMFVSHAAPFEETKTSFESSGKKISVEIFRAAGEAKGPAVLVLHGAGGTFLDGPAMRRFARHLAANGLTAFLVHYFDQTGTMFARDRAIHEGFDAWRGTVKRAVDYVATRPEVDPRRIGCFGYSLGGYLAIAQGAIDPRIVAVAELAGGIDAEHVPAVKRLPPMLLLHGERDARVPVANAMRLNALLARRHVTHSMKIYSGEGHVLSDEAQKDAANRATDFLRAHLLR